MRTAVGLPPELARGGERILRPRDAADIYVQPWTEFKRLAELGALQRVATGYYAVVPLSRLGDKRWRPSIEATALGIAKADYGTSAVALMGPSAARHHGVLPRAIGLAAVAVPKQRPRLKTTVGQVIFVKREVSKLDIERIETEFGPGWVTTAEQTMVDLAVRPSLGGLAPADVAAAIRGLNGRAQADVVQRIAQEQHKPRALTAIAKLLGPQNA